MLQRNMDLPNSLQLDLDDLLADLRHARRRGDLGRLALISFCEVRRWARRAGQREIAVQAAAMFSGEPLPTRDAFLDAVDRLIDALQQAQSRPTPAIAPAGDRIDPRAPHR
jgi:hypothetical protein